MKEHNIDQLFRQKLHQHGVTPSPAAWEQVANGLKTRRRKKGGYYVAAAVIAQLLVAGWFGLQLQQNDVLLDTAATHVLTEELNKQPAAPLKNQQAPLIAAPADEPAQAGTVATTQTEHAVTNTSPQVTAAPHQQQLARRASKQRTAAQQQASIAVVPTAAPQEPQPLQPVVAQALPQPATLAPSSTLSSEALSTSVAPVELASAEQVVIRYEANNQPQEEDTENAPEKVLSLLQKVKHGEVSLASIRQAKNNLLSVKFNKP